MAKRSGDTKGDGGQVTCVSLEVQDGRWTLPLEKLLHALTPGLGCWCSTHPTTPPAGPCNGRSSLPILEHCRRHGIWILADDVYERLVYAERMRSAPSFLTLAEDHDRLIVINSFSKAWSHDGLASGLDGRAARNPG